MENDSSTVKVATATIHPPEELKPLTDDLRADPLSLARIVLEVHAGEVLLIDPRGDPTAYVLAPATGLWETGIAPWDLWTRDALDVLKGRILRAKLEPKALADLLRPLQTDMRRSRAVAEAVRKSGIAMAWNRFGATGYPHLTVCEPWDLDANLRYIGASNGIVDLHEGRLLSPAEGRKHLVTVATGVPFGASTARGRAVVERLASHLTDSERGWLYAALGYALRGSPSRRMYALIGEPGGGKTTLKEALMAALGVYCAAPMDEILAGAGGRASHSQELMRVCAPHRVGLMDEVQTPKGGISVPIVKRLTGDGAIPVRELYKADTPRRATATLFLIANPASVPRFNTAADDAMAHRYRELRYPQVPERDPEVKRLAGTPEVGAAMLDVLVAAAAANVRPPEDVPAVAEARAERLEADSGELGVLAQQITYTGGTNLHVNEVWRTWCTWNGDAPESKSSGGFAKRGFSRRLMERNGALPTTTRVRAQGQIGVGWQGFTLREEATS